MANGNYFLHGKEVAPVRDTSGFSAPDYRDLKTGELLDYYTGKPLVFSGERQSLEQSVREIDSMC